MSSRTFSKILVANRGEIACRVMRTARTLGYRTVAAYSDADARAPHVALADEAVRLGPATAAESYLSIPALLAAARATGADAVHPGYGFLSERAEFADACAEAGLVFIGPPASAIRAMGDKAAAKRRMREAGVPCAPGYLGEDQSDERLLAEGAALGAPLLVKAVAGGGGRGMRLVHDLATLPEALAGARREALAAFGDGTLMLERLIEHGRHIEVQVFADTHGHVIHLGERDCTAQRRRQKVVEEAPSPIVSPALREALGADAVAAARAVGYVGAGTVEFIVDAHLQHHFLEMNTRLQVEHPVTECITGLDLVAWQLRVAAGEPLPLQQAEVRFRGHAVEVRLYAEDPVDGFTPQTGRVLHWRPQAALRDGVRIDDGIAEGGEVSPWYDAMVAKVIAHGSDRTDALRRLRAALEDAPLVGLRNNGRFLRDLLAHPRFTGATMTTPLLDEWAAAPAESREALLRRPEPPAVAWPLAAALLSPSAPGRPAAWASATLTLSIDGRKRTIDVPTPDVTVHAWDGHIARVTTGGVTRTVVAVLEPPAGPDHPAAVHLALDGAVFRVEEASPYPRSEAVVDPSTVRAPVAGVLVQLKVAPGDLVEAGQPLACVEAMKMEMWVSAAAAGTVNAVHAALRAPVAAGALLVSLDLEASEKEPR